MIPLAFPITTKLGELVSSIPVKEGTIIDIAIHAYQRCIWSTSALLSGSVAKSLARMEDCHGSGVMTRTNGILVVS